ncbi:LacI family DNA-binding transcriptional regulator [Coraliomargarita sp. SDUM461004]|uniref:LacI family DNA-binding transcriptional regulator n=1 Tax=Thalassobacterium sedimentorum TaxID=3041258 RepID=A0ABU1AM94_9BACT|nr:LacI family DNA-binding transcriptional regulator [Coraliomargarita sp. SDUM461004]MDQ8195333.1 LacI family DNA-binding transcriptional regulator [Coraliomargarita sp. SDUM461004]
MKEIAEVADCSIMTVSLALRNSPKLSPQTRDRIQKIAKDLGYHPNPMVSALMTNRRQSQQTDSDVIAVLTKFDTPVQKTKNLDIFYKDLWRGLDERAKELGFRLEEFPVYFKRQAKGEELTRILKARGIRAIILLPGGGMERDFPNLEWQHFCTVAAAFHSKRTQVHRIASDHAQAMDTALAQIEALGYRRPGLAMTAFLDPSIRYAMSGRFFVWQQTMSKSCQIPLIPSKAEFITRELFTKWYQTYQPDLILSLDPMVPEWLKELPGGKQSGFVYLAKKSTDQLAGVNLRTYDVGRAAINTLARELYLNHYGLPKIPELILVQGEWEPGSSAPGLRA